LAESWEFLLLLDWLTEIMSEETAINAVRNSKNVYPMIPPSQSSRAEGMALSYFRWSKYSMIKSKTKNKAQFSPVYGYLG
jgi:hypothetical protein